MKARGAYRRCSLLNRKQFELPLLMDESIRKKKKSQKLLITVENLLIQRGRICLTIEK